MSMRPSGLTNGKQQAAKDIRAGHLRYFVKGNTGPEFTETFDKVKAKFGIQIDRAIVGSGSIENDEAFIEGYNVVAMKEIRAVHGDRVAERLSSLDWEGLLFGVQPKPRETKQRFQQ